MIFMFFPKAPPEMGSRLDFGVQGLASDLGRKSEAGVHFCCYLQCFRIVGIFGLTWLVTMKRSIDMVFAMFLLLLISWAASAGR